MAAGHVGNMGVIATIRPSVPRRALAVGVIGALAAVLLWAGLFRPSDSALMRLMLVVLGGLAAALCAALWQATSRVIELTGTELREGGEGGRVLARLDEIEAVDRSLFAFKPSNGFLLRTERPGARVWAPGLWWRAGRRVGVGGVLRGSETRAVADAILAAKAGL